MNLRKRISVAIFEAFDTNGVLRKAYKNLCAFIALLKLYIGMAILSYVTIFFFYSDRGDVYYFHLPIMVFELTVALFGMYAMTNEHYKLLVTFLVTSAICLLYFFISLVKSWLFLDDIKEVI